MLWAITSFFNPCRYQRRLANYRVFRDRLTIPLIAVELTFDGRFELEEKDADILIQLHGGNVMWQKERLLNLALNALPDDCEYVAWLDNDIVFEDDNWWQAAIDALQRFAIIQPFERSFWMKREAARHQISPAFAERPWDSLGKSIIKGLVTPEILLLPDKSSIQVNCGFAWASRKEILDEHGLYDACILGCGDGAVIAASLGNFGDLIEYLLMNPARSAHYQDWAVPFFQTVRGDVGYSPGTIYHLWHGEMFDRHYARRRIEFSRFDFDPYKDIVLSNNGVWKWNSDKRDMHQFVTEYFSWRAEDGVLSKNTINHEAL